MVIIYMNIIMKNKNIKINVAYKTDLSNKERKAIIDELVNNGYCRTELNICDDNRIYKLAKNEDIDMVLVCNW